MKTCVDEIDELKTDCHTCIQHQGVSTDFLSSYFWEIFGPTKLLLEILVACKAKMKFKISVVNISGLPKLKND